MTLSRREIILRALMLDFKHEFPKKYFCTESHIFLSACIANDFECVQLRSGQSNPQLKQGDLLT